MKAQYTNTQLKEALSQCGDSCNNLHKENRRLQVKISLILTMCVQRRTIAIDMAAHIAKESYSLGEDIVFEKVMDLTKINQAEHDKLVVKYNMKERYGERK